MLLTILTCISHVYNIEYHLYACGQSSCFHEVSPQVFCPLFLLSCLSFLLCFRVSLYILHTGTLQDTYLFTCVLIFLCCLLVNRKYFSLYDIWFIQFLLLWLFFIQDHAISKEIFLHFLL